MPRTAGRWRRAALSLALAYALLLLSAACQYLPFVGDDDAPPTPPVTPAGAAANPTAAPPSAPGAPAAIVTTAPTSVPGPAADRPTPSPCLSATPTASVIPPTPIPQLSREESAELRELRAHGLAVVNNLRAGMPPLTLGVNRGPQVLAEDALEHLHSDHRTTGGLTADMLHCLGGGREYVSHYSLIYGFYPQSRVDECARPLVRCSTIDPIPDIEEILRGSASLIPVARQEYWDSVSLGIAYSQWTLLIYLAFERAPAVVDLDELRRYALGLINKDRADHGVAPVRLGDNGSAQAHAEDSLRHRYVGHWTVAGLKPYMLYSQHGGGGIVGQNAAGAMSLEDCAAPGIVCIPEPPEESIASLQWGMMYDDAHADWGHRDTIINPHYDTVSLGIAHSNQGTAYYQHFEYVGLEWRQPPTINDGVLTFAARPLDANHRIVNAVIHYDPIPQPRTPAEIHGLQPYCTGGGFTDECDEVKPVARALIPAELRWGEGYSYRDLEPNEIIAARWDESSAGVQVQADLGGFVSRPGVYSVEIWTENSREDSGELRPLGLYPVWLR